MTLATAALMTPAMVVSNATFMDSDSVTVSPCPSATMPGPRGISVPSRPNMGPSLAIMSVMEVVRAFRASSVASRRSASAVRVSLGSPRLSASSSRAFFCLRSRPLFSISSARPSAPAVCTSRSSWGTSHLCLRRSAMYSTTMSPICQTAPAMRTSRMIRQGIISAWAMVCSISLKEIMYVCSFYFFLFSSQLYVVLPFNKERRWEGRLFPSHPYGKLMTSVQVISA